MINLSFALWIPLEPSTMLSRPFFAESPVIQNVLSSYFSFIMSFSVVSQ